MLYGIIFTLSNKNKMSPGENQEKRYRRHTKEMLQRGALLSALTATIVGVVVKYVPNNLTSEHVKPPTIAEQTIESEQAANITSQNVAETGK